MKFSCERCQTRYSIGDDKVKGKVLKIRCKTCGNIIVVREQAVQAVAQAAEASEVAQRAAAGGQPSSSSAPPPPPPAASAAGDVDWYIAVKGKQHGPSKFEEIARLFRDGRITERTHLWHDKLPAWTRMKDLAEFAGVVAEGPAPKRAPPVPPPPPEEGAEIVNFEAARAQRNLQQQQMLAPPLSTSPSATSLTSPTSSLASAGQSLGPVTNDPFAALQGVHGAGGDNAPRESTRVFIMQAGLHNRQKKQRMVAGIAGASVLGFVALCALDYQFDILGLKRVVDAVAERTGIKEAPAEVAWDDADVDPTLKCKLMPDPAECVKKVKAELAKNPPKRKRPTTNAGGAAVSDADLAGAFGNGPTATGGDIARVAIDEHGAVAIDTGGMTSDQIRAALGGGKAGPTGPKVNIETPSVAGTTIDAQNAAKVVRDGQAGIQVCVDDAMKKGEEIPRKLVMVLNIELNGTVSGAVVKDAVVQAADLGACLTRTGRKWKFAPTTEAASLEIPLLLR